GVTQLGWDEKSAHKIAQMLALNLPPDIACALTAEQVAGLTGGVTQLGWDEKSAHKIAQMLALNLPPDIACALT
ncbi:hypothetical protein CK247_30850, partial [Klebsiella pneumoniae]